MQLRGARKLSASSQAAWAALHNGSVLQQRVPGAEQVTWQGDNWFTALLNVGIGPCKGQGTIMGAGGGERCPSHLGLVFGRKRAYNSTPGAGTLVSYNCEATIGGMAAALDNPLTRPLVAQWLGKFFGRLDEQVL